VTVKAKPKAVKKDDTGKGTGKVVEDIETTEVEVEEGPSAAEVEASNAAAISALISGSSESTNTTPSLNTPSLSGNSNALSGSTTLASVVSVKTIGSGLGNRQSLSSLRTSTSSSGGGLAALSTSALVGSDNALTSQGGSVYNSVNKEQFNTGNVGSLKEVATNVGANTQVGSVTGANMTGTVLEMGGPIEGVDKKTPKATTNNAKETLFQQWFVALLQTNNVLYTEAKQKDGSLSGQLKFDITFANNVVTKIKITDVNDKFKSPAGRQFMGKLKSKIRKAKCPGIGNYTTSFVNVYS
jgi:hypothetical protein